MKQYVIIAGAGISVAPPSNLPSWWEYNKKLIAQIKAGALELCPEAANILACIDPEKRLPVQCISQLVVSQGAGESYFPLLEQLNGTTPNANHFALAELARQGKLKTVITTNFDTLIEAAFKKEAIPLYTVTHKQEYYEAAKISGCKLIKIHGSVHDHKTLIDTVSQKAVGLSPEKRQLLEGTFSDSEILVIGFSGADLDFDINYIPFIQALEEGSTLTWIIRPTCTPNSNVTTLQEKYPDKVYVKKADLSELFQSIGVCYEKILEELENAPSPNDAKVLDQKIAELFSSTHIGAHGCIGYCLSMLEMLEENEGAAELGRLYEQRLDWSSLNVYSVLGINALARQKLMEKDWEGSIRCYEAVIQCLQQKKQLNNELISGSLEQRNILELEHAQNMVAVYQNLGIVYYYMAVYGMDDALKKAEEMLEKAYSIIQSKPTIPMHSIVTFNLGRVKYISNQDYDQYLNTLRISRELAQKEGRLDTLVEILHEECAVRMAIGEYYLAKQALSASSRVLKNVGRAALKRQWDLLYEQYQLRNGKGSPQKAKLYIQEQQKMLNDPVRKMVVTFEAQEKKSFIPMLFSKLCRGYLKNGNWMRLEDVALCYLDAACTDVQRSDALYLLGCAMMEQARYITAEEYFSQIVSLGESADQMKLGWTHSELSKLRTQKGEIQQAIYHFDVCLQILGDPEYKEELAKAGVNCVAALFEGGYFEEAEKCAAQLLAAVDKADAAEVEQYLEQLRAMSEPTVCDDLQDKSAQVIATEANRLHRRGNIKLAWKWIALAKEKYMESQNMEGVGRCENNMATWCLAEGNLDCAITHFKASLEIKSNLGDMGGVANQLAALLQLFLKKSDYENAKKIACYAEQNMPHFLHTQEKYALYFSLYRCMLETEEYAAALMYGEKAHEGLKYLPEVSQKGVEQLSETISVLKSMFVQSPTQQNSTEYEKQLFEAIRLYKSGKWEKSFAIIEQLRNQYSEDLIKIVQIEGTRANAYLHNKQYTDAISCFQQVIHLFEDMDEGQRNSTQEFRLTAINGMAIALGHIGKDEEALVLLRKELKHKNLPPDSEIQLTINLCNSLMVYYQDSIKDGDAVACEIQRMLDSLSSRYQLEHEKQGVIYCTYGMLYGLIDNINMAKTYYQQAKNEFLITNSPLIEKVEQNLKALQK